MQQFHHLKGHWQRSEVDSLQKELDSAVKRTQMQTLDLKEQKSKIVDLKLERDSWESQLRRARERYLQRLRDHLAETGADAENGRRRKVIKTHQIVEEMMNLVVC